MKPSIRILCLIVFAGSLLTNPSLTKAAPFNLFFEGDVGSALGDGGIRVNTYATFNDLLNLNPASSVPLSSPVDTNINIAGIAYDGQYRLMFEGDAGSALGDGGIRVNTYTTFNDLLNLNPASSVPLSSPVDTNINIAGIAYDGQYRLMFEGDAGSALGDGGIRVNTYATFNDLLNLNPANSVPLSSPVDTNINIAGIAYDGQYRLMFEGDAGSALGDGGIRVNTYATFNDLLNLNPASSVPLSSPVDTNINIAGIASPYPQIPPVPLPAAVWMFLTALGGLGLFGWRRRRGVV